ncbi:MAG: hypothetical protein IPQ23_05565 [Cytophagaceae bacterium]|nr:hypothetical protein [Cytophagaceae bacterium]
MFKSKRLWIIVLIALVAFPFASYSKQPKPKRMKKLPTTVRRIRTFDEPGTFILESPLLLKKNVFIA